MQLPLVWPESFRDGTSGDPDGQVSGHQPKRPSHTPAETLKPMRLPTGASALSSKLQFALARAVAHGADHDLHVEPPGIPARFSADWTKWQKVIRERGIIVP